MLTSVLLISCTSADRPFRNGPAPSAGTSPGRIFPPQLAEQVSGEDFYRPPDDLPAAEPGRLVRLQPLDVPAGMRGWRVLYHSTSVDGQDTVVSGQVFAPEAPAAPGTRAVVAWGHGSVGLGDNCAPSRSPNNLIRHSILTGLLSQGYVVAATDYEGLGTPGPHPWLVGQSEGRGVLDSVRAARQVPEAGASNRFVTYGGSQGGGAVLFAGELASEYAGELELLGVVAAAPAAELDLLALLPQGGVVGVAGFVVMGAFGFKAAYPELELEAILLPDVIEQQEEVERLCQGEIDGRFRRTGLGSVLKASPVEAEGWGEAIIENTPGRRKTPAPVLLVHGDADQVIPVDVSRLLFERLCGMGVVTQLQVYNGVDHAEIVGASGADVTTWILERTAGTPVRERPEAPTCS